MKKFIVFGYTSTEKFDPSLEPSKEERQEIYAQWGVWQKDMGDLLVSMGSPLINGVAIEANGLKDDKVSDLSGYMIIKAKDKIHAIELLNKSPLFGMGHGQRYELFECIM
jgi:hypothetical protein